MRGYESCKDDAPLNLNGLSEEESPNVNVY